MSLIPEFRAFIHWWGEGLYAGLPDGVRKLFRSDLPRLVLHMADPRRIDIVWQQDGKQLSCGQYLAGQDGNITSCVPQGKLNKPHQVELRLGKAQALHLQRPFPEAVRDNLRQVVGYQLDRLTPFAADAALFDTHAVRHDKAKKEVVADIHVVPRSTVSRLQTFLAGAGIGKLDAISIDGADASVNLLRDGQGNGGVAWSRIPLYFFIGALVISLLTPLAYKYRRVGQIEDALVELRQSSAGQLDIRDKLMEAEDALGFIEEKRKTSPVALEVVEKLSTDITEHTWLERLSLDGRKLEIQGESDKALSLIDTLEETPEFSGVRFKSPVTRNKDSGNDRFQIEANVEVANAQ
jgi:general secretion pathway protein L